jgi:hypothetical protein
MQLQVKSLAFFEGGLIVPAQPDAISASLHLSSA